MTVFANGRSILHKGHGKTQLAIAPDVCKTPSPAGPVPIPYPNFSADSNLTEGAATVKISDNPAATTQSKLGRSNGDEPGTAGGVVSSKNMGAFGWAVGSIDVIAEGNGVVRMLDSCLTNGNAYNDTGINVGETALGYGDDAECPREDCKLGRVLEKHRVPETVVVANLCSEFADELRSTASSHMSGSRYGRMIGVGVCECNTIWKAISGAPMPDASRLPQAEGVVFCNEVNIPRGDKLMSDVVAANNQWKCAALKILSNAAGHKIVSLSEKWVGNKRSAKRGGGQHPKYVGGSTAFRFPIATSAGMLVSIPDSRSDRVRGAPEGNEIPSGGSVPSCGACQTFLPALVCEMKPCS